TSSAQSLVPPSGRPSQGSSLSILTEPHDGRVPLHPITSSAMRTSTVSLLQYVVPLLENASRKIMEGRSDRARLQAIVVCLARARGIDRFDRADGLRKHLHARRALDEHREHGRFLNR